MRIPCFVANWKMNKTLGETLEYLREIEKRWSQLPAPPWEVVIAPPFTALASIADFLRGRSLRIGLAAQNLYFEERGAYTGEISPLMLTDVGCRQVIIGHSERRSFFGETDATVHQKFAAALRAGLIPIVCIGETWEERQAGKTGLVVERQLGEALGTLRPSPLEWIVAYEPVWAIGTGRTPEPAEAESVHRQIRDFLGLNVPAFTEVPGETPRILYGGSVTEKNIVSFMKEADIDGVLAGGASLSPESFFNMIVLGMKAKNS